MSPTTEYVFGYGSLVAPAGGELAALGRAPGREGFVADLHGMRRGWGVAMDNRVDLPGYKCYLDPGGKRPAVFVSFLDIADAPGDQVNGVCLAVGAAELDALDRRERNYDRVDVTDRVRVSGKPAGRVWVYRGSREGRTRFREGVASGAAVIHEGYLAAVRTAFQSLGASEWDACAPSLDPVGLPVVALVRCELA